MMYFFYNLLSTDHSEAILLRVGCRSKNDRLLSSLGIWPLQILQRQRDVPVSIHAIFDRTKVDNIKFTRKYITLRYKKDDVNKSRIQLHFHQTLILLRFLWCLGRSQAKVNFIFNIRNILRPNTWIKKMYHEFQTLLSKIIYETSYLTL